MLRELANTGYEIGAVGIFIFTASFVVGVRWWTDRLGQVLASVLSATSAVLVMSILRMIFPSLATNTFYLEIRVAVFWAFGIVVWAGLASFVWAQFFAPRLQQLRNPRMTTRREHRDEEGSLAGAGPRGDGDSHDRTGSGV